MSTDPAFIELRKIASERSKPIVFWTGAGVSAPLMPSWRGLLAKIIEVAKEKAKSISDNKALLSTIAFAESQNDLWVAFERLSSIDSGVGPETFRATIKNALSLSDSAEIPPIQSLLWQIRPKGVVTLNLDLFTLRAMALHSETLGSPIQILPGQFGQNKSVFKEIRPFIAYPHGHFDNFDTWTFTSTSLSVRFSDGQYTSWVDALFSNHVVVFVGISADDVAVGGLLDRISRNSGSVFRDNYWFTSRTDHETDVWAERRGIRVIRYNAPGDNHDELVGLLKGLSSFKAPENKDLESPLDGLLESDALITLPPPDEMDLHDKEALRRALNAHAKHIFLTYKNNDGERDGAFRLFLSEYADSVHNAYYTSITPGKNNFLGYTLASRANGGAFGSVYKAYDKTGNLVAIKVLHSEKLDDVDFYRNFRRGVNSLRILGNRKINGIVQFIDAVEIPPSLVMEWIEGPTLSELVHQKYLEGWRERLVVMNRLATVLRASHSLPERVLHRDLRPANVMIRDYYTEPEKLDVVVLDFDLSWHRGAEDHSIMYSPALGYLAPEQRRRIAKSTTRTTLVDSYGFGMVMYFAVTGKDPIPDAHLIPKWVADLQNALENNRCREWFCVPKRVARLIIGATQEDQSSRLELAQIQGELQNLIDYIDSPTELSSISILTEELAMRTDHMQGYIWNESKSTAEFQVTPERRISLEADMPAGNIVINIEWNNAGAQDWGQISRLLERGYPRLLDSLRTSGWHVVHTKATRSFKVTGEISAHLVSADVQNMARLLDKSLSYAFAIVSG